MSHLHVLLVQLPVPNNPATNVPLAAGYLKAYAHTQGLLDRIAIDILPRAIADHAGDALLADEIVARAPQVLGLSLYTWNSERSLDVVRRVKQRLPNLFVIVGGPEVQRDNAWVLHHPAVNIAVLGEGEQTFAELLALLASQPLTPNDESAPLGLQTTHTASGVGQASLVNVPGIAFRDDFGMLRFSPERVALNDLSVVPSPYLLGYLDCDANDGMLMVEVSRWCPYSCSFCLYGRNMGSKLGNRYFSLEQILAEICWGRERGLRQVHFIEANLNLVPLFRPLMHALQDLNADGQMALYAELRGEHLSEEAVQALVAAGLRVAEVGLQTANPLALKAALRRTDLAKWAAGTRRLYAHGVEVMLDVILGLPEDDADGVAQTLDFLEREALGPYDIFTLQMLPGTAVRTQAAERGYIYQDRPPYYVLRSDRLEYTELRKLRRTLKRGAGFKPDAIEGCPEPRYDALATIDRRPLTIDHQDFPITRVWFDQAPELKRLATHVDVCSAWSVVGRSSSVWLAEAITANPSTLFDVYLLGDAPQPAELRRWHAGLPYQPGYLDRVAVYQRATSQPAHVRVSPRVWLVVPWTAQVAPEDYADVAEIIWAYDLAPNEPPPLGAWRAAGGAGVFVRGVAADAVARWREESGILLWHDDTMTR